MIANVEKETQSRTQQAAGHAREDLSTIRTGRAYPAIFNRLNADYYGAPTSLQQLATFNSPDPWTMLITPFGRSAIVAIEKITWEADLGVNPSNDGNSIRAVMLQLTEECRKEYIKLARAKAEGARVAVCNTRRHSIDTLKKLEKKSEISEDESVRAGKAVDVTTRKYVEAIDELFKNKEAGLSEI